MKIVQVLDYFTTGNAVANCAVMYYQMTQKLGIECAVAARLIGQKKHFVKDISYLDTLRKNDIVMYHMCIGTPLNQMICNYACKKVLVYHNITPPEMLEQYEAGAAEACREGLEQILFMKNSFSVCLAMSAFNQRDLMKYGYRKDLITVIPPYCISDDKLQKEPDKITIRKYKDGWINIVFVGRISPNKKQEDLIRIFQYYKTYIHADSRLILVGGGEGKYYGRLQEYIENTGIRDVVFTGQVPFTELLAIYRTATVFVCASEHEGFCIPLMEAMYFGIPAIAYDAAAVSETMGGAGILLKDRNPILAAKVIHKVCTDQTFRIRLIQRQKEAVKILSEEAVFCKYKKWLRSLPGLFQKGPIKKPAADKKYNPYDVVVVIKAEDWDLAKWNLKYIKSNLKPKRIVLIASAKIRKLLCHYDSLVFIDEDELYPGLTYENIRRILATKQMGISLAGWYLQQFLKLAYAFVCKDEYYLVWDADTVPLQKISMIDSKTGKPYFDMKPEYVGAYFSTIHNLIGMEKAETESFISEHMLFCTKIVRQMLAFLEKDPCIRGGSFYEKILNAASYGQSDHAFSEFELYGTFCQYVHPDWYQKRHLKTLRCGKMFLGVHPDADVLQWAGKHMDTVSFEHVQPVIARSQRLSMSKKFREKYSVLDLLKRNYLADCLTFPEWLRTEKEELNLDYPWARQAAYLHSEDFRLEEKEKRVHRHIKIAIFGESENVYFCGMLFARKGMQVLVIDENYDRNKIAHFRKYWGFQAFFERVCTKTLNIAKKIPKNKDFQFVFFSSAQPEQYMQTSEELKDITKGILLEHTEGMDWEQVRNAGKAAWINTSLWQPDAMLFPGNQPSTEIWEDSGMGNAVTSLFSGLMKVGTFADGNDFFEHVGRQAKYLAELQILQDKYGMTI